MKLCPRLLSGRWGRKSELEDHILALPQDELVVVLEAVLRTRNYFLQSLKQEFDEALAAANQAQDDEAALDAEVDAAADAIAGGGAKGGRGGRGRGRGGNTSTSHDDAV